MLRDDLLAAIDLDKWRRIEVSDLELNAKGGTTEWLERYERVYVGASSITICTTHEKLITWRTYPATSGELARAYLRQLFAQGASPLMATPGNLGFATFAPIFCEPVKHRTLAYVDIEQCYHQLLIPYRPDDMPLGRSLNEGNLEWWREKELGATRHLRHSIAGSMWTNHVEWCQRGRWRTALKCAQWANPYMKRRVLHTLHAVVHDLAAHFNVHAWLTDAAIVDAADAQGLVTYLARTWRLSSRIVAEGAGAIWSATAYVVGDKASLGVHNGRIPEPSASSNLILPDEGVSWLCEERQRVAA